MRRVKRLKYSCNGLGRLNELCSAVRRKLFLRKTAPYEKAARLPVPGENNLIVENSCRISSGRTLISQMKELPCSRILKRFQRYNLRIYFLQAILVTALRGISFPFKYPPCVRRPNESTLGGALVVMRIHMSSHEFLQYMWVHNEISGGILQKFLVSRVGQSRGRRGTVRRIRLTSIPSRRRIIIRHLFSKVAALPLLRSSRAKEKKTKIIRGV